MFLFVFSQFVRIHARVVAAGPGAAVHDRRLQFALLLRSLDALVRVSDVLVQVAISLEALAAVLVGAEEVAHIGVRQLVHIEGVHVVGDVLAVRKVTSVHGLLVGVGQHVDIVRLWRLVHGVAIFMTTAEDDVFVNVPVAVVVAAVLAQLATHLALVLSAVNRVLVLAQNGAKVRRKVAVFKVTAVGADGVLVVTLLQVSDHLLSCGKLGLTQFAFIGDCCVLHENLVVEFHCNKQLESISQRALASTTLETYSK